MGVGGVALQRVQQTSIAWAEWGLQQGNSSAYHPLLAYPPLLPPPTPQIDFEQDTIISQENEYEILQIMMGDLRDRCAAVAARPGWGCSWRAQLM